MSGKLMLSSPPNRKGTRPVRLSKLWPAGSTKLPRGAGVDYVSLFCYLSLFSCQRENKNCQIFDVLNSNKVVHCFS